MIACKSLFSPKETAQETGPGCTSCQRNTTGCPIASFPIAFAQEGERVKIIMVRGGGQLKERLLSMGLHLEDIITVVRKQSGGATIIEKSGCRYALGGGMSHKINVIRW